MPQPSSTPPTDARPPRRRRASAPAGPAATGTRAETPRTASTVHVPAREHGPASAPSTPHRGERPAARTGAPARATRPERPARGERTERPSRPVDSRPAESRPAPVAVNAAAPASVDATETPFADLGVPAELVAALAKQGKHTAFPIQVATLPDTLARRDVLGRGRTGSGKTLAFSIPMVSALMRSRVTRAAGRPRGLVLVPTRELANQVLETLKPLADSAGLRTMVIFGGVGQNPQVSALRGGVDIVVACPGRLEDLMRQGHVNLGSVEVTVLDEADHMADLGFLPVVKRLLDTTPSQGHRMLFSATLDNGVDVLVDRYLHTPVTHSVDPPESPVATMIHHVLSVTSGDKNRVVSELASGQGRSLLFMRTKHTARRMARQLTAGRHPRGRPARQPGPERP